MGRLLLHRLVATVPVLVLVTAGVFALIHLTPGDPIDAMMAESVDDTVKATMRKELGLDRPIYLQYAAWMGRVLQGDLGRSIRNREPVIENVGRRIRPSLELAALAMVIAIAVAFPVGIVSAARRHSAIDGVGTTLTLALSLSLGEGEGVTSIPSPGERATSTSSPGQRASSIPSPPEGERDRVRGRCAVGATYLFVTSR